MRIIACSIYRSLRWPAAVSAVLLLLCRPLLAQETFSASALAEGIWVVAGPAGNTLVAQDSEGLILLEGVPAAYAEEYLDFVRTLSGEVRIRALVNTHWHPESAGLNASLASSETTVIAHFNTRQWLASTIRQRGDTILHTPVPVAALPDTTFRDRYSLPFREGSIELAYLLHAHTDGDIYAWFPEQNILFTGPIVRSDGWNAVDESSNGFVGGMLDGLHRLSALINADSVVVPAAGKVLDKAGFDTLLNMYQGLFDAMVVELRKAHSAEEMLVANPARDLMPEWGSAERFLDQGFRSFYGHLRSTRHVGVMP